MGRNRQDKAATELIASLQNQLEDAYYTLSNVEEELREFKEVTEFFLGDFTENLDNIQPEDLELALIKYQDYHDRCSHSAYLDEKEQQESWKAVFALCKDLGIDSVVANRGFSSAQQVKIFIKTIFRNKILAERRLADMDSMERNSATGGRQDGFKQSDDSGSSPAGGNP